jgi:hypothetical protein
MKGAREADRVLGIHLQRSAARFAESEGTVETFIAASREFAGHFSIHAPISSVFELFSPLGERAWVPDWNPELLHPSGVSWARGQIFRTQEERGDAIWIVTCLDRDSHDVEYHRVEPHRYVARVRVRCVSSEAAGTDVATEYGFVGLSAEGNDEIAAMTAESYAEKMNRWQRWISVHCAV